MAWRQALLALTCTTICKVCAAPDTLQQLTELNRLGVLDSAEFERAQSRLQSMKRTGMPRLHPYLSLVESLVDDAASPTQTQNIAGSLSQLVTLKVAGMLTDEEFAAAKQVLLSQGLQATSISESTVDSQLITWEELKLHNTSDDLWTAIHGEVYNFSCFSSNPSCYSHPGGLAVIEKFAGADATVGFEEAGHQPGIAARKGLADLVIGKMAAPAISDPMLKYTSNSEEEKAPYGANPEKWAALAEKYGGGAEGKGFPPGGWRAVIGRSTWHFIHSTAGKYPKRNPTPEQEAAMRGLLYVLEQHYPCEKCRYALPDEIKQLPPMPTGNREDLSAAL